MRYNIRERRPAKSIIAHWSFTCEICCFADFWPGKRHRVRVYTRVRPYTYYRKNKRVRLNSIQSVQIKIIICRTHTSYVYKQRATSGCQTAATGLRRGSRDLSLDG